MIKHLCFIFSVLILTCARAPEQDETIVARVGDRIITEEEFIRRAEYTVRPPYCNGNTPIHRKIVLNSLIAEKMMALEAGENNPFISSADMQEQLRGRKEQAMRLVQFFEDAYDRVEVDSSEINQYFPYVTRKYRVAYYDFGDSATAQHMVNAIHNGETTFEKTFDQIAGLHGIPMREVAWNSYENEAILRALFSGDRKKEQTIGPVKISDDQFMLLKIVDWDERPIVTEKDVHDRWQQVSEKLKQLYGKQAYDRLVHSVMKGKTIRFSPNTFRQLANVLGPHYMKDDQIREEISGRRLINLTDREIDDETYLREIEQLNPEPLFDVSGEVWTVGALMKELVAHPLVFREKRMKPHDFGEQLQFAIIDLIRDHYMTREAYRRGYDKSSSVLRNVRMWEDNQNYLYHKANYLRSLHIDTTFVKNDMMVIDLFLNPYVDSLQKKYSDDTEINVAALDRIRLTRIDMSVIQKNVPFAKPVPGFPLITTDFRLDYGRELK